jgi:hypothetical protein
MATGWSAMQATEVRRVFRAPPPIVGALVQALTLGPAEQRERANADQSDAGVPSFSGREIVHGEEKLGRAGKWAGRGGVGLSAGFAFSPFLFSFLSLSLSFVFKFRFQI